MARSLSNDLRGRLVAAVEGGMSRRSAAQRYGVAVSTAITWLDLWTRTGSFEARPHGGDRRSARIERHADEVLALVAKTPDTTLAELAQDLEKKQGVRASGSMVWRLLDRHGLTFKKNRPCPASNTGPTFCGFAKRGSRCRRNGLFSLTKPALLQRW